MDSKKEVKQEKEGQNWLRNSAYLFEAIKFVLASGAQLSATMSGELSSHMKHSVNQQILNKLNALLKGNSLKGNGSITLRQLTSRFSVLRG